jgi:ribosomal protein S18 acetylase RimI-like enzyme
VPAASHRLPAVYHFRPFSNSDPPRLAEIWRSQPSQRGVTQGVSAGMLEQFVFSKPYFDPDGLIVALDDQQPVGFAHASFGPNEERTALDTQLGTTQLLMLRPEHRDAGLADELLGRAEGYLRDRGAKVLYGGGIKPLDGFYLGLYGGSELPGVLVTDLAFHDACLRNGYREIDRVEVLHRDVSRFRLPFSREQRRLRREVMCKEAYCPPARSWWDACTHGSFERLYFRLEQLSTGAEMAHVWFWDIEPLSTSWGVPTCGMFDMYVAPEARRKGYAAHLLSEAFDRLRRRDIVLVEAHVMQTNTPALELYKKLGYTHVDQGIVFRKE